MIGFILLFLVFGAIQLAFLIEFREDTLDALTDGETIGTIQAWSWVPGLLVFTILIGLYVWLDEYHAANDVSIGRTWDAWKRSAGLSS